MKTADDLRAKLVELTGLDNVYTRPPSKLKYPCILIELTNKRFDHADNSKYFTHNQYQITVVSSTELPSVIDSILDLPYTSYSRSFISDNLQHSVIDIYF